MGVRRISGISELNRRPMLQEVNNFPALLNFTPLLVIRETTRLSNVTTVFPTDWSSNS